jgi:protein gp37
MGCDGCPLYPTTKGLVTVVTQALGAAGFDVAKTSEMASTALGGMAPSEAYHRRRDIAEQVAGKLRKMNDRKLRNGIEKAIASKFSCYASVLHLRHGKDPLQPDKNTNKGYAPTFEQVTCFPGRMAKMARMKDLTGKTRQEKPWLGDLPRLAFVSDMGDALSAGVPFEYLQEEIVQVAASPKGSRHVWQWLTKRPARMAEFARWLGKQGIAWPRNLVPMASVIDGRMAKGIQQLRKIPAAARGLSVEPLLEPVELNLDGYDWVIVGGESGSYARPFELAWARDIARQCREAGCAFFMKQLGAKPLENGRPLKLVDKHGADWDEWPEDLRVREMPEAFRSLTVSKVSKVNKAKVA